MKLRILGDIHGQSAPLKNAVKGIDYPLIQVGDFGWGSTFDYLNKNPNLDIRFIHGNHEKYHELNNYKQYLGKYGTLNDAQDVFFISGAWSIDQEAQIYHGVWGPEEELSYEELEQAIKLYEKVKPRVVLSHTFPAEIAMRLISPMFGNQYFNNRTEEALQWMFDLHKPEMHLAGHWHKSYRTIHKGTEFICLNINEWMDIEL